MVVTKVKQIKSVNKLAEGIKSIEDGEKTIGVYLESLKAEMLGCGSLLNDIKNDPSYMTLLSILQYFIDHPDCDIADVRREVFRAIRICNKIAEKYSSEV